MRSYLRSFFVLLIFIAARAYADDKPIVNEEKVTPGSKKTSWYPVLDQSIQYNLKMNVSAKNGKFVPGSAQVKSGGLEVWKIIENSEQHAFFDGTVPPNQDMKQYKPFFHGLFQPGSGGNGGTGNADLTWEVTGVYSVSDHVYEKSGTDPNGNPAGIHKVNPTEANIEYYDIDVPCRDAVGNIQTMRAVYDALAGEGGEFQYKSIAISWCDTKTEKEDNQKDPKYGDENMMRRKITGSGLNNDEYRIKMPRWKQLTAENPEDRPGAEAVADWNQYYAALLAHEIGHREIYLKYMNALKNLVDVYAKTLFWAEVCYGANNKTRAQNRAKELAEKQLEIGRDLLANQIKNLNESNEKEQNDYNTKTDKGKNQQAVGGKNVVIHVEIPLQ